MAAKRTITLHIRVEEELAEALKELADSDERKVSPYVARVLRRHVDAERRHGATHLEESRSTKKPR
jgi:predicted transcriptional regulator